MVGETQQAEEPSQSAVLRLWVSVRLAVAAALLPRPSRAPLRQQDTPWLGEAETGPPLTSVGLSVSCNRK